MSELLLAEAIITDLRAQCLKTHYAREWRHLNAIGKLAEKLRARRRRLDRMQGPSFGSPHQSASRP